MTPRPSTPAETATPPAEAVEEALASVRLEGLEPSPEVLEDARRFAAGELDPDELIERTLAHDDR